MEIVACYLIVQSPTRKHKLNIGVSLFLSKIKSIETSTVRQHTKFYTSFDLVRFKHDRRGDWQSTLCEIT